MNYDVVTSRSRLVFGIIIFLSLIFYARSAKKCERDEDTRYCYTIGRVKVTFCTGGSTGLTPGDIICIMDPNNACDVNQRNDSCGECDKEQTIAQFPSGSQYRDCNNTCHSEDTKLDMLVIDHCGICGGDNSTCVTFVTDTNLQLIPGQGNSIMTLTGSGFLVPDVKPRIVTVTGSSVTTLLLPTIESIDDEKTMTVKIPSGLQKGELEIRAGIGTDVSIMRGGPKITVYIPSDYDVTSMTPTEVDITPTVRSIDAMLMLDVIGTTKESDQSSEFQRLLDIVGKFRCIVKESISAARSVNNTIDGTFNVTARSLKCPLSMPEVSEETWICASFNGEHDLKCKELKFYHPAPTVIGNNMTMTVTDVIVLEVHFDQPVSAPSSSPTCDSYFVNTSSFGTSPRCLIGSNNDMITIHPGDSHSLKPDDIIELKSGFKSHVGKYGRETGALNLTIRLTTATVSSNMKIVIRGQAWPSLLTTHAPSPLLLSIDVIDTPDGRPPQSVRWQVNDTPKPEWDDLIDVNLDVTASGAYFIVVTSTDFLGSTATLDHFMTKSSVGLPNVVFFPAVLQSDGDGKYQVYPNTVFAINARITYDTSIGIAAYNFTWTRDGQPVDGQYYYKSTKEENTIDMCSTTVEYKLTVSEVSNPVNQIDYSMDVLIICRDPVARIRGNIKEKISIDTAASTLSVDGRLSYDPDAGSLKYTWSCEQTGGQDCLDTLSISDPTLSHLSVQTSKLASNNNYIFTLTVKVNKSDGLHEGQTQKLIYVLPGQTPVIRFVTQRTKFRHNVPIMLKAHIGPDTEALWSFVVKDGFDFVDVNDVLKVRPQQTVGEYTWIVINPDSLLAGRWYSAQVWSNFTSGGTVFGEMEKDIYIYEKLRGCYLEANDVTELQETSLALKGCIKDPAAGVLRTNCYLEGRELPSGVDVPFFVPVFKDRSVTKTSITCTVMDGVGHSMEAVSNEVVVTLDSNTNARIDALVQSLEADGRLFDTIDVLSGMIDVQGNTTSPSAVAQVVDLTQTAIGDQLTVDEAARLLHDLSKIPPDRLPHRKIAILARQMRMLLGKQCGQSLESAKTSISLQDTQKLLDLASQLVKKDKSVRYFFHGIGEKLACIRFKALKNEEEEVLNLEGGGLVKYMYRTLDDVTFTETNIRFPPSLQEQFRDVWQCGESEMCHGVGIKVENYTGDPPALQTGRTDLACAMYTVLELYNPYDGSQLRVKDLKERINMNFGNQCPRTTCWWYNFVVDKWDQSGVKTVPQLDGTINCETHHLSMFSVRSGPEMSTATNWPLIASILLGLFMLILSISVIIKVLIRTLKAGKEMAEIEEPIKDQEVASIPSTPYPRSFE